jgi:hypothetical protein
MVRCRASHGLIVASSLVAAFDNWSAAAPAERPHAVRKDQVIAGGPNDFMEVRHVVLEGTNEEIGSALGTIARERHKSGPPKSADRYRTRVQRRYIKERYPILFERMRGVAMAFGKNVDDDGWEFGWLPYLVGPPGACSVVHYPPSVTADGQGVVSRNYEFSVGTVDDNWPRAGELPPNGRPYVMELHPDRGYASLALYGFDLLSGVIDGINSEGLTVTLLADYGSKPEFPVEPVEEGGVGLDELQVPRMLLDTCANVEQAKEALLLTKQYYAFMPQHYLIADRHGKSFVWEYSYAHNREYVIENPGKPLISTNFHLHRYLEGNLPPSAKRAQKVCPRYAMLARRISAERGKLSLNFIIANQKAVNPTAPGPLLGLVPPVRTLWHALYFPDRRAVRVDFYLREEPDPDRPGKSRIVRSGYQEFVLRP